MNLNAEVLFSFQKRDLKLILFFNVQSAIPNVENMKFNFSYTIWRVINFNSFIIVVYSLVIIELVIIKISVIRFMISVFPVLSNIINFANNFH